MAAVNFSTLLPQPAPGQTDFFLDGDYSQAFPVGMPVPTFPFLEDGDTSTVQFRQKFEQALVCYAPPNLKLPMQGTTNLYPFGDVNWSDGQAGVALFERRFGNIPATRTVHGQSYRYPYQYLLETGAQITGDQDDLSYTGASYSLGTLPTTVDCTVVLDYFLDGQQASYPLLEAPMLIQIGQLIVVRGASYLGSKPALTLSNGYIVSTDVLIMAEDDTYVKYEGAILARKRQLIAGPTASLFNSNLSAAAAALTQLNFSVSPNPVLISQNPTLTFRGSGTNWTSNTTFTVTAGTLSNVPSST